MPRSVFILRLVLALIFPAAVFAAPPAAETAAPKPAAKARAAADIDAGNADDAQKRWVRFQPEFDAFAAADRANPPRTGEILLVGSSVFRRWKTVAEQMAPLPVLNRAFGGSRTGDQLARFDQLLPVYRPAVVVYYCGSNDLKAGNPPDEIYARFREFSARMMKLLPEAHLVFVSSTRSPDRKDKFAAVDRFNALVRDYCAQTPRHHFVDVNPALVDTQGEPLPGVYGKDDLHPEAPGYEKFAAVLQPALAEVWRQAKR
jgi:lysophospholipase L1-like esterase